MIVERIALPRTAEGRLDEAAWHALRREDLEAAFAVYDRHGEPSGPHCKGHGVKLIAHESVHRHAGTDAAHVFGGWLAIVEIVAARTRSRVVGVRTQEIHAAAGHQPDRRRSPRGASKAEARRAAAARRKVNKAAIVAAAQARGWQVAGDDEADACFVGLAVMSKGACQ